MVQDDGGRYRWYKMMEEGTDGGWRKVWMVQDDGGRYGWYKMMEEGTDGTR